MRGSTTTGISIQRTPYSESSEVVDFLTRDFGRITCMVKGAFRQKNNYQGNIDLMVLSRLTLARKRGRSMALLRQRRLVEHYPGARRKLESFGLVALMAELLRRGIQEDQIIPGLFDLTVNTLDALEEGAVPSPWALFVFQGTFLKKLGYEPVLDRCANCHTQPPQGSALTFYPGLGGVVCRQCNNNGMEGFPLSWRASRVIMASMIHSPLEYPFPSLPEMLAQEVWLFFKHFFQYFLEKRINAYAFIHYLDRASQR
jgi:DNA repair protein RecO (recombination protein O)